jgi:DNA polymerase I
MGRKIMLLDGNSLTYRAFFALPADMATASGQVTNAVFGFTSMLQYMLNEHKPQALAVTFDRPEPTFRHHTIPDYKAGRAETPDILRQQMGLVRQVVEVLGLPMLEIIGFEADDVLATLATQGKAQGDDVIIVTGDRDSYQLVEDATGPDDGSIRVLYNKRGVSDYALYDEAGIVARTGVHPVKYSQYAALRGDPSDNLPGVPGVGEKTAAKLINEYGGIDGIYENVAKCTPKLRDNLVAAEEVVRRNAGATILIRDVPDISIDVVSAPKPDMEGARELFKTLEFRALTERVFDAFAVAFGTPSGGKGAPIVEELPRLDATVRELTITEAVVLPSDGHLGIEGHWVAVPGRSQLLGVAWGQGEAATYASVEVLSRDDNAGLAAISAAFGSPSLWVHGHKLKELIRSLHDVGMRVESLRALGIDTAVAGYLLDPAETVYDLEELTRQYASLDLRSPDAPPVGQLDFGTTVEPPSTAVGRRAVAVGILIEPMLAALTARGLAKLYDEIEKPLIGVLARMEIAGVRVDTTYLKELSQSLTAQAHQLEEQVQELAGRRFTVNSVPQLRTVLFDELGLKTDKKTKTGYSTDAQALEKVRDQHPIVDALLRYREVEKLRSTYGENLLAEVQSDGRIHATFNQTVARTGRLSSDQPNLHNIPIRSEEGRQFRRAFIPGDACEFLVADYNQIELRVIAHLAQDPGLITAFQTGADVHTETAKRVFSVEAGDVTMAMRSKAKMVSYGLAYGMESYGLAQRLGVPVKEAQVILDAYFEAFPNVRAYMDQSVTDARNKGYTETLFGRRRQIPELQNPNFRIRQMGERQAMNAGIQGLAADIFKVALVRLDAALREANRESVIILQVHDEVIVEVPEHERDEVRALTIATMREAAELSVPLEVNVSWGKTWADAKG